MSQASESRSSQAGRSGGEDSHPGLCLAIAGATGAVGEVLLRVLEERDFPVRELRPLASRRSVGQSVTFRGQPVPVQEALPDAFEGVDIAFFAATGSLSQSLAPEAVRRGAVVIDKSNTWRLHPDVPLVVPEVNASALDRHQGIIACPNCTTTGVVMALEPIRRVAGLEEAVVTTLQAASGAGREGSEELHAQSRASLDGEALEAEVFPTTLAGNVLPLCERFLESGYSTEEMKLVEESRKILELPSLPMSVTCVRVPVDVGHSAAIRVSSERPLAPEAAREALAGFPGVEVVDDPSRNVFPTPLEVAGSDAVRVGRVRRDLQGDALWLWEVSDNLRKGAATNAVQIAEALIERKLVEVPMGSRARSE